MNRKKLSTSLCPLILLAIAFEATICKGDETSYETADEKTSEILYVAVYHGFTGEIFWVKQLMLDFNNSVQLPMNYSLSGFGEHFQGARFGLKLVGGTISLDIYYDAIDVNTAEGYADEVTQQFIKAFNLGLVVIDKTHTVDNRTNYVTVNRELGYISYYANVEELVKYKPANGFGQLITTNFLRLYVTPAHSKIIQLEYTLTRTFSWRFILGVSATGDFEWDKGYLDLNLNELLNNSGPITPGMSSSKIIIEIEKTRQSTPTGDTYFMSLSNITPGYTGKTENDTTRVIYDLAGPIDNVVARIAISRSRKNIWDIIAIPVAITIGLVIMLVIVFIFVRKRKR